MQAGITREALASYEDGRAPLRTGTALRICRQFIISEKWLALGFVFSGDEKNPFAFGGFRTRLCMDLARSSNIEDFSRNPFAETFGARLSEIYEALLKDNQWMPRIVLSPEDGLDGVKNVLSFCQDHWAHMLNADKQRRFLLGLIRAARILFWELNSRVSAGLGEFEKQLFEIDLAGKAWSQPIKLLTSVHASVKPSEVQPQWPLLKRRLQKATEGSGSKSKLAKFLGAKLASVSQWLTDSDNAREPGAETALRMLRWVEQQERK